jgi:hypothetical protein
LIGNDLHLIAFAAESFDLVARHEQVQLALAFMNIAEVRAVTVINPPGYEFVDLRLCCPHTDGEDVVIALVIRQVCALIRHGAPRCH